MGRRGTCLGGPEEGGPEENGFYGMMGVLPIQVAWRIYSVPARAIGSKHGGWAKQDDRFVRPQRTAGGTIAHCLLAQNFPMDDARSEGVHNRLGPDISWRPALPHMMDILQRRLVCSTTTWTGLKTASDLDTLSYKNFTQGVCVVP